MKTSLFIFSVAATMFSSWPLSSCGVDDPDGYYPERLIAPLPSGALGRPCGESVVVQGKVVSGPFKYEDSLTEGRLLVQRINGVATQQGVVIRFDPVTPHEWWGELEDPRDEVLWKIQETKLKAMSGKTFEMRGYEQGRHVGMTQEEFLLQAPVQTDGFKYELSFHPLMMKSVPEVHFAPADFIDRVAEFEGRAETRDGAGYMIGPDGWVLQVRDAAWPADFVGREISAKGRVSKTAAGSWRLQEADWRLLRLDDQLGKEARLDGIARALNDHWWFEYRGEKLYVENQKNLPGWTNELWGRVVTISGVLDREKLPSLDQITLKKDRDLQEYYIVRHASWSALDLAWKKPPVIPKAQPLTGEYLESCGIKLDVWLQKRFDEWAKRPQR
jgi:hypothetical protein